MGWKVLCPGFDIMPSYPVKGSLGYCILSRMIGPAVADGITHGLGLPGATEKTEPGLGEI